MDRSLDRVCHQNNNVWVRIDRILALVGATAVALLISAHAFQLSGILHAELVRLSATHLLKFTNPSLE